MNIEDKADNGPVKEHRSFTHSEVGELFDKVLVDSSYWGDSDVTDVGEECSIRTFGPVYCGGDGLKVYADTQYFIEVHGNEVFVDASALGNLLTHYESGGIDAAVVFLKQHFASLD